jgi:hypothetical protein
MATSTQCRYFYARHKVRVYRFILCLVRNKTVAEDLVSGVFLDVWRQANGFRAKSRVSTWLLAIVSGDCDAQASSERDHAETPDAAHAGSPCKLTRWPRSLAFRQIPSKRACSTRAVDWRSLFGKREWMGFDRDDAVLDIVCSTSMRTSADQIPQAVY